MLDAIRDENLPVEILMSTAAQKLELDENGAISGVLCADDGGEVHISAPVVILQCGGFGKSDEKLREFAPGSSRARPPSTASPSHPTPATALICCAVWAWSHPGAHRHLRLWPKHHPFNNSLADYALEPEMLQINLNGKRWIDEAGHLFGMTPHIAEQPRRSPGPSRVWTT